MAIVAASAEAALETVRSLVDPAVRGPVTEYKSLKENLPGEYGYVEPAALDMTGVNPVTARQGEFAVSASVFVQSIDNQDKAARYTSLWSPTNDDSVQRHIWAQCPDAQFGTLTFGTDADTGYLGFSLLVQVLIVDGG